MQDRSKMIKIDMFEEVNQPLKKHPNDTSLADQPVETSESLAILTVK